MSETQVMDPGDSERERMLHEIARLQRELASVRSERDDARESVKQLCLARMFMEQAAEPQLNAACGWAMLAGMLEGGVEREREECAIVAGKVAATLDSFRQPEMAEGARKAASHIRARAFGP